MEKKKFREGHLLAFFVRTLFIVSQRLFGKDYGERATGVLFSFLYFVRMRVCRYYAGISAFPLVK